MPLTSRCEDHSRHSSTALRAYRTVWHEIMKRSWLKLARMTRRPSFSGPIMFSLGTKTLSKVTYAVPAVWPYAVLICLVSTPSVRGTRNMVRCLPVRAPTEK